MASPIVIRLTRDLPHAPERAFGWLTDFEDADADRAGAVIRARRVVAREKDRVVYEGEQRVLGRETRGTSEVTLAPPDRWTARVLDGPRAGSVTSYRLDGTPRGSRLTVEYHIRLADPKARILATLLKPLVRRELSRMWDGFERSMAAELPPG